MSSGVFVHTFALAFRTMSSVFAKSGPSKEAAPVLEIPEKDRHKQRFEKMMTNDDKENDFTEDIFCISRIPSLWEVNEYYIYQLL